MQLPRQSATIMWQFSQVQNGSVVTPARDPGVTPSGGGSSGNPPPGCYPNGTKCRGWKQYMVYCCGGGVTWEREEGWCVGWWDALPCR